MHLSGLSPATKKQKHGSSFGAEVGHLVVILSKCLRTFLFDLQLKFDLAWVKAIIAAIKSS